MSNFRRQQHLLRPDSRATGGGSRFTHALSAVAATTGKREDYSRPPPLPSSLQHQAEEQQLEEVEQKITLALQAIDANFDHCQRTMARDVMPKVERLAKLSSDLLHASQPWLQFFMAVAAADDEEEDDSGGGVESLGVAQRAAIEEQMHKGDITARFPEDGAVEEEEVDLDAEIDTPQLTSRYMTQEFRLSDIKQSPQAPATPRVRTLKRSADMFSVSAKKRKLGTPAGKDSSSGDAMPIPRNAPSTPLSMMRALVHAKSSIGFRGLPPPGSNISHASRVSSSMATDDLMPDTSPPHTTTFTLPKSRHHQHRRLIAPAHSQIAKGS
ncbi:DASH complex subunit ask1, partial [Coemansia aciculifera]